MAGCQELCFEAAEIVGAVGRPLARRAKPRAAIQRGAIAPEGVPLARGVGQAAVHEQADAITVNPATKPRPAADQRFVGDIDDLLSGLVTVCGQQPRVDEPAEDLVEAVIALGVRELMARCSPAGVLGPFAGLCEAQQ